MTDKKEPKNKELQSTGDLVELADEDLEKVAGGKVREPEERKVN